MAQIQEKPGIMNMHKTRCYRGYASVPGRWNIEVFYTVPDFGYWANLVTCIECGEIFVIDFANPAFKGKTIQVIAGSADCPRCRKPLCENLRSYPESFRTDDGRLGHFDITAEPLPESESFVREFLEIC